MPNINTLLNEHVLLKYEFAEGVRGWMVEPGHVK